MSRWYGALAGRVRARGPGGRVAIAAVLAALVLGIVGAAVVGGRHGTVLWFDGTPAAAPAGEPEEEPEEVEPESGVDPDEPARAAEPPPPYVQPFAQQPGVRPRAPLPSPTAGVDFAEGTDGCDHAYGDRDVCVPWEFPSDVTDKCAWLRERGFEPLPITGGRDRHRLDRNGDGTACGAGD